jgi:hypothetical protein
LGSHINIKKINNTKKIKKKVKRIKNIYINEKNMKNAQKIAKD